MGAATVSLVMPQASAQAQSSSVKIPDPGIPSQRKYLRINQPYSFISPQAFVLAGTKAPGSAIIIGSAVAIPANPYTTWYYEYTPASSDEKIRVIMLPPKNLWKYFKPEVTLMDASGTVRKMNSQAPYISAIRVDPATRDIILTFRDPPGVLSYNIYYANSLTSAPGVSPFILAQRDVPVSGSGSTVWRDNGTYTRAHPSQVAMRFYKLEVCRADPGAMTITIDSLQDGEVISE